MSASYKKISLSDVHELIKKLDLLLSPPKQQTTEYKNSRIRT